MGNTTTLEQQRNRFILVLKGIHSAKSITRQKQYSHISVTDTLTHIVGYRESGTKFRINIDTLYDIYAKGNIESLRPSDLKQHFPHSRFRSPACAILHAAFEHEKNLDLHEAMIIVLWQQKNHTMHRTDLAQEIEEQGLYQKGNKTSIDRNQISARVSQYPQFFKSHNGMVSLI